MDCGSLNTVTNLEPDAEKMFYSGLLKCIEDL